jgi:hypothetical protein
VALGCTPSTGTLPFTVGIWAQLFNVDWFSRTIAGRLSVLIANGHHYDNWRSGTVTVGPGNNYLAMFNQLLPDSNAVRGANMFTLSGMDVTASPYNQPPYSPSGDTDSGSCVVIGN